MPKPSNESRTKFFLISIFIVGFVYRLAFSIWGHHQPVHSDAVTYDLLAKSILELRYSNGGVPVAFYTPGYPLFLASIYSFFGVSNYVAVRIFQAILSSINLVLFYYLVKRVWDDRTAVISFTIAAFYSPFLFANGLILTEVLYTTVLLIWINHLTHLMKDHVSSWSPWLLNGLVWGLVLTVRPVTALFIPLLVIGSLILRAVRNDFKFMPRISQLLAIFVGAVIVLSPWTIRNYHTFHKLIPFSAESGNVFLLGTYPDYKWEWDYPNWPHGQNEVETDSLKIKYGIARIVDGVRQNPFSYTWWYIRKFNFFWFYPYTQQINLLPSFWIQALLHKTIVWFGFAGMALAILKRKKPTALMLVSILGYLTIMHMAFMTLDRLAFPTMYLVILFAGIAISYCIDRLRGMMINGGWKKYLSLLKVGITLATVGLLVISANSRFSHYSLLQWLTPVQATMAVISVRAFQVLISFGLYFVLSRRVLGIKKSILLSILMTMFTFNVLNSVTAISNPYAVLKGGAYVKIPMTDKEFKKVIDIPVHLADRDAEWKVKVRVGSFTQATGTQKLTIKVDGRIVGTIVDSELNGGVSVWKEFPIGQIESNEVTVVVEPEGDAADQELFIWNMNWKNFGLTYQGGDLQPGSIEVGLSKESEGLGQIPIWYGSSSYTIRQHLLLESEQ